MVYNGKQLAKRVLEINNRPMSCEEIWEYAKQNGIESTLVGKTPGTAMGSMLRKDIKAKGTNSDFYQYSIRPGRFFLTERNKDVPPVQNVLTEEPVENTHSKEINRNEIRMHPFLVSFLSSDPHFGCHCLTINASESKKGNKGANVWRYPDVVGVHFPFDDDYEPAVLNLFARLEQNLTKLFSFEIKQELRIDNVRESFFQAISNSSWANEGYLVAGAISGDVIDELRSLTRSFGIGVILLDMKDPAQSEILFPSDHKEYIDEDAVNALSDNAIFKRFIIQVDKDCDYGEAHEGKYDAVLSEEELTEMYEKFFRRKK